MTLKTQIGYDIYRMRRKRGLTRTAFAKLMGVNYRTVSRWESGEHPPSWGILELMKKKLGVNVYLLFDDFADKIPK